MGVGDISTNVNIIENACAMESIVDELLLEIGDAFVLHKQQQEATTNTCSWKSMVCCTKN